MSSINRFTGTFAALLAFSRLCAALPALTDLSAREIEASSLRLSYDYVIVGGGQAGLVVANRLSENSGRSVLVVEFGSTDRNPAQLDPSSATQYPPADLFNVTSIPMAGMANRTSGIFAAATTGGGSTVNGMMLERGAPKDYDDWAALGNPGWAFKDLLPYFKKSTQLTPPDPVFAAANNITFNLAAYGNSSSPIKLSYATFQYEGTKPMYKGMLEAGVQPFNEQGLSKLGVGHYPSAMRPKTVIRSYAVNEYLDPVASRSNLDLLLNTRVNEVKFDSAKKATGVTIQRRAGGPVVTVKANKEVILAAGFLHSPVILQRSGVGPAALLNSAKVPVVVDLPGVGSNYQDHPAGGVAFSYATDILPNPAALQSDPTFQALATQLFATNRTGPLSIGVGMAGAWVQLPTAAPTEYKAVAAAILQQNASSFLPTTYTSTQVTGFKKQRELIAANYKSNSSAAYEIPFGGNAFFAISLEHPLSRGLITLNPADKYGSPIVDFGTFTNPMDPTVLSHGISFIRRWASTPSFKTLTPTEVAPGPVDDLVGYLRQNAFPSTAHGSGTCHMAPRNLGGVVAPDLTVYGVTGLSIADASIFPMVPGSHTCATTYAVAEKAADLIKSRNR